MLSEVKFSKKLAIFVSLTIVALLAGLGLFIFNSYSKYQSDQRSQQSFLNVISSLHSQENQISISSANASLTTNGSNIDNSVSKTQTKLLFTGDVMLGRTIGEQILKGIDPFEYVHELFKQYDYVIVNLECTVSDKGLPAQGKLYTLQAPISSLQTLKQAGVKIVSLANNHTMDFGATGLTNMLDNLHTEQIPYFGVGHNALEAYTDLPIEHNGNKLSLLGFNEIETNYTAVTDSSPGNATLDGVISLQAIQKAKQKGNLVLVMPHWGTEYNLSFTGRQQQEAYQMLDSGADLIVGAHPHVIEPNETHGGKTVYYSLGNFVFDEMPTIKHAGDANMLEVIIDKNHIKSSKTIPVALTPEGFPKVVA